jgi:uncharacterized coiled-coil protein SlyX
MSEVLAAQPAEYQAHCQRIIDSYQVIGFREEVLAQSIAEQRYTVSRIRSLANNLMAKFAALQPLASHHPEGNSSPAPAGGLLQNHPVFNTLSLWEHRTYRNMEKDLKELNSLQAERKARAQAEAEAKVKAEAEKAQAQMEDAVKLQNLYQSEGQLLDPQEFGFAFSSEEIEWEAWRRDRLRCAQIVANRTPPGRVPHPTHKKPPQMATN